MGRYARRENRPRQCSIWLSERAAGVRGVERRANPCHTHDAFWRFSRTRSARRLGPSRAHAAHGNRTRSDDFTESAYFAAFRRTATTPDGIAFRSSVARQEQIPGLTFAESDFIDMAQELAVRHVAALMRFSRNSTHVLPTRIGRRASRSSCPRCRQTPRSATHFRQPGALPKNAGTSDGRRRTAIPESSDRRSHAERYIKPSLDMLQEIQRTGDIFFARLDERRARRPQLHRRS